MADCCGARRCTCTLIAGPGVEIEGGGSTTNPYVVSAPGTPPVIEAGDTDTVDTTVSGTGTTADPVVVSSVVRLDPDPPGGGDNLIRTGPDGLFVECEQVRGCLSAGDGITYDEATGTISARPSEDAGNTLVIGSDGGLHVPASDGGEPTVVQAEDTDTVDTTVSGTGTTTDPIVVSSEVRLDPNPPGGGANLIQSGSDGLFVELATDCGLTGDGSTDAPLAAAVSEWPYTRCEVDDYAGNVYCDSNGVLRSEPRTQVIYDFASGNESFAATNVPSSETVVMTRTLEIVNPSACRPGIILVQYEADVDFILPPGASAGYTNNGDEMVRLHNRGSAATQPEHVQTLKITRINLPAGGVRVPTLEIGLGWGVGGAQYTRIQWSIKYFLFIP